MNPHWGTIESESRGLSIETCRLIGEGWNSLVYLVNNELVFRFPKRSAHWEELQREIAFLEFAADHLSLPVPRYVRVARNSPAAPHGYAVYRYLAGEPMDLRKLSQPERDAAADALAGFLLALHSLKPSPQVDAALPREDPRTVAEKYLQDTKREIVRNMLPSEASVLLEQFHAYLSAPANFSFQPAVIHADFSCEHILIENGSVAGAIDFGDVNWGDPDYDFMYMFVDFGWPFVGAVARRYGHPDQERLRTKLRYFATVDQVGTIVHGAGLALDGQEREAWRRLRELIQEPARV